MSRLTAGIEAQEFTMGYRSIDPFAAAGLDGEVELPGRRAERAGATWIGCLDLSEGQLDLLREVAVRIATRRVGPSLVAAAKINPDERFLWGPTLRRAGIRYFHDRYPDDGTPAAQVR